MKYIQIKNQKMEEIVTLLDLFGGKITLSELLTTDISLLNQLRDAKIKILERQNKEETKNSTSNVKIVSTEKAQELTKQFSERKA